ncbi:hypothetical protein HYQ45_000123 [Verticillium longisporum]|uniref:Uncharacterized protein n=1 Tax=Verticillium longisporum TaxID=100787 RepID=A0A8I3AXX6_VERLO|nr:hypothetical protein HYQ45_000123 [Verticillium longisporum]
MVRIPLMRYRFSGTNGREANYNPSIPPSRHKSAREYRQLRLPSNPSEHEHPKTINIAYNLSERDSVTECPSVREILNT